jgi:hypothetical protein
VLFERWRSEKAEAEAKADGRGARDSIAFALVDREAVSDTLNQTKQWNELVMHR